MNEEAILKVYEIRINRVAELSEEAQSEVSRKLQAETKEFREKFEGYAKVVYAKASPLRVISVDPIEGSIIDYLRQYIQSKA